MMIVKIPKLDSALLLKKYGLRPNKKLGQNFLQDPDALRSIIDASHIDASDTVLEIGPGLGSLTRYLAASARQVVAVELDQELLPPLKEVMTPYENITIIQGDILELSPKELIDRSGYVVVANIPYYITSAIIRHLLESGNKPRRIVLTIQKEVAERICARPGNMSLLALSVQVYGRPHIAGLIPANAFHPIPKVDSAILCIEILESPEVRSENLDVFFRLIRAGFSQKRKTLRNALSSGLRIKPSVVEQWLIEAGIDPMRRAETLSLNEWETLCIIFSRSQGST